ncbi:MAG: TonB-dependent receptor family protein [Ferruginibacter sp.]
MLPKYSLAFILILFTQLSFGQKKATIKGYLKNPSSGCAGMTVSIDTILKTVADNNGFFEIKNVPFKKVKLEVFFEGQRRYKKNIQVNEALIELIINITDTAVLELEEMVINKKIHLNGLGRMDPVRGTALFEAKKNDVLVLKNIDANLATNNTRQVFSKVAGINVWENDGSGIQVNVSSRGLSPNRSWEYNTRQNGYDIAADILGYPDMYYSPPMEAVSYVEVVRGSASLQYGTQMGGLLNFVLKQGNTAKPIEIETKQSVGSYGLFNSYTSIGGSKKKWTYFGYYHHRAASGWRQNSDYRWNTGFASVNYKVNEKLNIGAEFTKMEFLLHLSAGLTDSMYQADARSSVRERNWFKVNWNIPSVKLEYAISDRSKISLVTYMLLSSRKSIENTKPVNFITDTGYRDIRTDHYRNFGAEFRYLTEYKIARNTTGVLAAGIRFYKGRTLRSQGLGSKGRDADYSFLNPGNLEYSDYAFRNLNTALFVENIFRFGKLSVVPGIRYEYIRFFADGYFNSSLGVRTEEKGLDSKRQFPLFGIGSEYKLTESINLYANYTQGYRSANFNDIRITAPNIEIDPGLKDSRGSNADLGIRGKYKKVLNFDISGFILNYKDRIGLVTRTRADNSTYLISTNIADSRNMGIETFAEWNIIRSFNHKVKENLLLFVSYAYTDARYTSSEKDLLKGKKVETAPNHILRSGLTFKNTRLSSTINYSYISRQYSDANNTIFSVNGSNGMVPDYYVMDWSSKLSFNQFSIGVTINNFTNNKYFTRRATSYPGPGVIPAEPRTFLISAEIKL